MTQDALQVLLEPVYSTACVGDRPYPGIEPRRDYGHAARSTGWEAQMQVLGLEDFAGRLNETFNVDVADSRTPFVLVEARPLNQPTVAGQSREPFSLLFRNQAAIVFPQRIYNMHHETTGEFGIFLTAIARDRDGFLYQAVFN